MKYMMLVHHDQATFVMITKDKQQQMLAQSFALTQQLHHYLLGRRSGGQLSQQKGSRP